MSLTSSTGSTSIKSISSKELCVVCQETPYDLICTCRDKFCFTCIHLHVEQMGLEFQFAQGDVGERLLQVEQKVQDNSSANARTIVENWRRKRIQDVNDIADEILHEIQEQEDTSNAIAPLRNDFNALSEGANRVVHEQLTAIIELQQKIREKLHQLNNIPDLLCDDTSLDQKLQSRLNPNIPHQNSTTNESEPIINSTPSALSSNASYQNSTANESETVVTSSLSASSSNASDQHSTTNEIEPTTNSPPSTSNTNTLINTEPTLSSPPATPNRESTREFEDNHNENDITNDNPSRDEFEAGLTANIQRRDLIIISTNNDKFAGTVCCHENQLIYNDFNQTSQTAHLILIPDIARPTIRQNINWTQPDTNIGGGDDNWIQDIVYSNKLQGYLLLNRSRLRLLHDDTFELEEYYTFPDRSIKRVTCNDTFIYLISSAGNTAQHGDEIILMNHNKEETVCKTFRDIILTRSNRISGPLVGELSDIAVSANGQVTIAYRLARRSEVGVHMYNVSNDGKEWSCVKQLLLNECWHADLSYTPRIDWCEKLKVFILIEHMTSHLIMLDSAGQVKGECRLTHTENEREAPINLSVSTNDWLCIRYGSAIDIHRILNRRT